MLRLVAQQDKILHAKAKPVLNLKDPGLKELINDMKEIMKHHQGIGLAAPQIGKSIQVFVIDQELIKKSEEENDTTRLKRLKRLFKKRIPDVFINPAIRSIPRNGFLLEEGCLSVPNIFGAVPRAREVVVEALNERGKRFKVKTKGLCAHVLQHEIDHLYGVLFIEKAVKGTLHKIRTKE